MPMQSNIQTFIDLGPVAIADRLPLAVSAIEQLSPGAELILTSQDDLSPVHELLPGHLRGLIVWRALERGPDAWRVRVQKGAETCGCRCSCN